jgi:hypothetical protein
MHGAAGRLLAIAQGGVEEDDLVRFSLSSFCLDSIITQAYDRLHTHHNF